MQLSRLITSLCTFVCTFAALTAQTVPPSAPAVVVINFNAAVLATGEAQRDLGALQAKFSLREAQLQKMNDSIEAEKRQLSDAATKLSEAERNARAQATAGKEKQLQRDVEDFKNDSQTESQQIFQRIAQKLFTLLQDFASQRGYAAVIERGTESASVVWYAANGLDITESLARAYDAKSGIANTSLPAKPASGSTGHPTQPKGTAPVAAPH